MAQPPPTLYRMPYRSRQTPETVANLDFEVGQIVGHSIRSNRELGITGLLLVVQGRFIQALEGNIGALRTAYARISMDRRHHDLPIISQSLVQRRAFGEWNMCAGALAPSAKAILTLLDAKGKIRSHALTADNTLRLLTTVAGIQRNTALTALVG